MSESAELIARRDSSAPGASASGNPLRSRKWTAYALTLVALVTCAVLRVEAVVLEHLSIAVVLGLPALLGGQSAIDFVRAKR